MYKLNYKKRVWIVKQYLKGISSSKIALSQSISTRTVQILVKKFKQYGWESLKDHKTGRPETVLNRNAEIIIFDLRRRFGYGALSLLKPNSSGF